MIVDQNQGFSLMFISSLQLLKSMHKGCKIYVIPASNKKRVAEGLEHLPVGRYFVDVLPKELLGMPPKRVLEFTIDLKPRIEPIARARYRMLT
jgi:hypothetical protein